MGFANLANQELPNLMQQSSNVYHILRTLGQTLRPVKASPDPFFLPWLYSRYIATSQKDKSKTLPKIVTNYFSYLFRGLLHVAVLLPFSHDFARHFA